MDPKQPIALDKTQHARVGTRSGLITSDFDEVNVPPLPKIPGMISPGEARYLYWLVSQGMAGVGTVVEVGTWLGLSTSHLAIGLRDSGTGEKLHSFDNFEWTGSSDSKKSGIDLKRGDDFQSYFMENIKPFAEWIEVTKGNFEDFVWRKEDPIEVLFLDAPKDAASLGICLKTFGPALIPGTSTLVSQDYQHPLSYDLALAFSMLSSELEMIHSVESGGTVGFAVKGPITVADGRLNDLDWRKHSRADVDSAWERILEPLQGRVLERLKSGRALHLCEIGDVQTARDLLATVTFDDRLHAGWSTWGQARVNRDTYGPILDFYAEEFKRAH